MRWWKSLKRHSPNETWTLYRFRDTSLFLALMLWICALPLVAILGRRFLGWEITLYLAGFLLVADLVVCWFLCNFRIPRRPEDK